MRVIAIVSLLVLPGPIFLAYSQFIGNTGFEWKHLLANYAWCSAVLYCSALILMGARASVTLWLATLAAGNAALIAFCFWMASLLARGYRDTEIAWVLLFPAQALVIALAVLAHWIAHRNKERPGHVA